MLIAFATTISTVLSGCNSGQRQEAKIVAEKGVVASTTLNDLYAKLADGSEKRAESLDTRLTLNGLSSNTNDIAAAEKEAAQYRNRQKMAANLKDTFAALVELSDYNAAKTTREATANLYTAVKTQASISGMDISDPLKTISSALARTIQEKEIRKTLPPAIEALGGMEILVETERATYAASSSRIEEERFLLARRLLLGRMTSTDPQNPTFEPGTKMGTSSLGWDTFLDPYKIVTNPQLVTDPTAIGRTNKYQNARLERIRANQEKATDDQARATVESFYAIQRSARLFLNLPEKHPLFLPSEWLDASLLVSQLKKPAGVPKEQDIGSPAQDNRSALSKLLYQAVEPEVKAQLDVWSSPSPVSAKLKEGLRKELNRIIETQTFGTDEVGTSAPIVEPLPGEDPSKKKFAPAGVREVLWNRQVLQNAYPRVFVPLPVKTTGSK